MNGAAALRRRLPFRSVNRRGDIDYDAGLQRHHLLPCQLLSRRCFGPLFDQVGSGRVGFDDFRRNGILLPASDPAAVRLGLPLHRGPHRDYNALVIERVGQIEATWAARRLVAPEAAREEAAMRLALLQKALRRRLLEPSGLPMRLNRRDPRIRDADFSALDAMVDALWGVTEPPA